MDEALKWLIETNSSPDLEADCDLQLLAAAAEEDLRHGKYEGTSLAQVAKDLSQQLQLLNDRKPPAAFEPLHKKVKTAI